MILEAGNRARDTQPTQLGCERGAPCPPTRGGGGQRRGGTPHRLRSRTGPRIILISELREDASEIAEAEGSVLRKDDGGVWLEGPGNEGLPSPGTPSREDGLPLLEKDADKVHARRVPSRVPHPGLVTPHVGREYRARKLFVGVEGLVRQPTGVRGRLALDLGLSSPLGLGIRRSIECLLPISMHTPTRLPRLLDRVRAQALLALLDRRHLARFLDLLGVFGVKTGPVHLGIKPHLP